MNKIEPITFTHQDQEYEFSFTKSDIVPDTLLTIRIVHLLKNGCSSFAVPICPDNILDWSFYHQRNPEVCLSLMSEDAIEFADNLVKLQAFL